MLNVLLNFLYTGQNLDETTSVVTQYDVGNIAAGHLYGTENMTTDSENLYDSSSAAVIPAISASTYDIYKMSDNALAIDIYDSKMEITESLRGTLRKIEISSSKVNKHSFIYWTNNTSVSFIKQNLFLY